MQFANRIRDMSTEQAFHVLARAKEMERQGIDMIHMEIGDIDFDTAASIKDAAARAIGENKTHYVPSQGILEFREKIAQKISQSRKIPVDASEVVATPGGKPVIFYAILALVNPGDEVIVPDPGFPAYEAIVSFVGAKAVSWPIDGDNFQVGSLENLISPKTRLIIVNSPHNPGGGIMARAELESIAALAAKNDIFVLSDEVYDELLFEGDFESIASLPGMKERTVILNAFTKSYSMSGWRLGYAVCPNKEFAQAMANLINLSISCTTNFNQWAGIAALDLPKSEIAKMKEELKNRRDVLAGEIAKLPGVSVHIPKGAIYLFPDISKTGRTSKEVADFLFDEAHIAALSGTAFGKNGEGYIRLSFGMTPAPRIKEAIERMKNVWPKLVK
jgi:aspartate/methionine/tyrosine aminotransferase